MQKDILQGVVHSYKAILLNFVVEVVLKSKYFHEHFARKIANWHDMTGRKQQYFKFS